jgi:hypothetical protein
MSRAAGQRRRDVATYRAMAESRGWPAPHRGWRGWARAWAKAQGVSFSDMWLFWRYGA